MSTYASILAGSPPVLSFLKPGSCLNFHGKYMLEDLLITLSILVPLAKPQCSVSTHVNSVYTG